MTLTPDQIGELAPDAQVLASGRKLGKPTHWQSFGRQGSVVWGECRGGTLYQVRADTMGIRFKCSCPSRKQPCKHVIGLLALDAEQSSGLPDAVPPAWVTEWLVRSEARADGKKQTTQPATDRVERRSMERRAHILGAWTPSSSGCVIWCTTV